MAGAIGLTGVGPAYRPGPPMVAPQAQPVLMALSDGPTGGGGAPSGKPTEKPTGRGSSKGFRMMSTMVGSVLTGLLLGIGIDHAAGTKPLWTGILGILFVLAGMYQMIREANR